jgi:hypothetical protein
MRFTVADYVTALRVATSGAGGGFEISGEAAADAAAGAVL